MTLKRLLFRYTRVGDALYPLIPVRFIRQGVRTPHIKALLDSGSDRVLIPLGLARFLGLRLVTMARPLRTVGGEVRGFEAHSDLVVGDGPGAFLYKGLTITVIERMTGPILLGRKPIFGDCIVTFDERHDALSLEPVGRSGAGRGGR